MDGVLRVLTTGMRRCGPGKARVMVVIVRGAGMPAVGVMLASAMRGAEDVCRFGHVLVITVVNTR